MPHVDTFGAVRLLSLFCVCVVCGLYVLGSVVFLWCVVCHDCSCVVWAVLCVCCPCSACMPYVFGVGAVGVECAVWWVLYVSYVV